MKLLIVGYGKMGRMVEEMAAGQDIEIVGRVDEGRDEWRPADVAWTSRRRGRCWPTFQVHQSRTNVVIGTTGWGEHAAKLRPMPHRPAWIVAAPNFSIGVNIFPARRGGDCADDAGAAAVWRGSMRYPQRQARCAVGDRHPAEGRDEGCRVRRPIDMSSSRAGNSRHAHDRIRRSIGYDRADPHGARPSRVCGALVAARWIKGRSGWYSMQDVGGLNGVVGVRVGVGVIRMSRGRCRRVRIHRRWHRIDTPFTKDGSLDESAIKRLARRQIDAGVHFLSPAGRRAKRRR